MLVVHALLAELPGRFFDLTLLSAPHGSCPLPVRRHSSRPQLGLYNLVAVALGTWGVQRISATRVRRHGGRRGTPHCKVVVCSLVGGRATVQDGVGNRSLANTDDGVVTWSARTRPCGLATRTRQRAWGPAAVQERGKPASESTPCYKCNTIRAFRNRSQAAFLSQATSLLTPLLVAASGTRVAALVWLACAAGAAGGALVALDGAGGLGGLGGGGGHHAVAAAGAGLGLDGAPVAATMAGSDPLGPPPPRSPELDLGAVLAGAAAGGGTPFGVQWGAPWHDLLHRPPRYQRQQQVLRLHTHRHHYHSGGGAIGFTAKARSLRHSDPAAGKLLAAAAAAAGGAGGDEASVGGGAGAAAAVLPPALSPGALGAHYVLASCVFWALSTLRMGVHTQRFRPMRLAAATAAAYACLALAWLLAEVATGGVGVGGTERDGQRETHGQVANVRSHTARLIAPPMNPVLGLPMSPSTCQRACGPPRSPCWRRRWRPQALRPLRAWTRRPAAPAACPGPWAPWRRCGCCWATRGRRRRCCGRGWGRGRCPATCRWGWGSGWGRGGVAWGRRCER